MATINDWMMQTYGPVEMDSELLGAIKKNAAMYKSIFQHVKRSENAVHEEETATEAKKNEARRTAERAQVRAEMWAAIAASAEAELIIVQEKQREEDAILFGW